MGELLCYHDQRPRTSYRVRFRPAIPQMALMRSGSAFRCRSHHRSASSRYDRGLSAESMPTSPQDKKAIAENIRKQARYAKALFIWTDCDREGEHIGSEVRQAAWEGNQRIQVKRARFSNTERA